MRQGTGTTRMTVANRSAGFTLIEMILSIGVIAVLIFLLLGGIKLVNKSAVATQQRMTIQSMKQAVSQFKQEFGFLPPLVKDHSPVQPTSVVQSPSGAWIIAVYATTGGSPARDADLALLRGQGVNPTPQAPFGLLGDTGGAVLPGSEYRFSERTIAYYLAGQLEMPRRQGIQGVPIDGHPGPGMFPPMADGSFKIPVELANWNGAGVMPSGGRGKVFQSMLNIGVDPTLFRGSNVFIPADATDPDDAKVEVRDRRNATYRYYRWEHNAVVNTLADLNVPRIIGEDPTDAIGSGAIIPPERDLKLNAQLRSAKYAIVGPGKDGLFGDEPASQIAYGTGIQATASAALETKARREAAKDNIVEVGE